MMIVDHCAVMMLDARPAAPHVHKNCVLGDELRVAVAVMCSAS